MFCLHLCVQYYNATIIVLNIGIWALSQNGADSEHFPYSEFLNSELRPILLDLGAEALKT